MTQKHVVFCDLYFKSVPGDLFFCVQKLFQIESKKSPGSKTLKANQIPLSILLQRHRVFLPVYTRFSYFFCSETLERKNKK